MSKPIVLRLGEIQYAQQAWKELEKVATIITIDPTTKRDQFIKELGPDGKLNKIDYITRTYHSVTQTGVFDKELIQHFPKSLKAIAHTGAGYDQIDAVSLAERKVQLSNTPSAVDNATADTHVFLLLGALRNFHRGNVGLLKGEWKGHPRAGAEMAHDPQGKTVGIVGLGGIGRNILKKLKPFGFERFIYYNRNKLPEDLEAGAEYVSFDELLATSDIISINVPLNKNTYHLFNDDVFSKIKKGAVLVNTARGSVIDETALIKALKDGTIRSAGLDVLENEPDVNLDLVNLPNVLALPHMGTSTIETLQIMEELVVKNIETVIETGKVLTIVPEHKNTEF